MATIADLLVKISGDSSGLRKELNAVKRQIKTAFGTDAMELSSNIERSFKYIGAAMLGVGVAAVTMSAKMEMTKRAFEVLTGSAEKAQTHLDELERFAAATPFEFAGLTDASKKLQAYGFSVDAVIPVMNALGDASMAVGLGQEGMDRITLALGQINAKGKVTAEEMRQLAETGIPAWELLASKLGMTTAKAMEMSKKGAISAKDGITALLTGLEERFGGMMEKVNGEIPQSFNNMKDSVSSIMRSMGADIIEALDLKTKMKSASDWMSEFAKQAKTAGISEAFENMVPFGVRQALVGIGVAITAITIPALVMLGASIVAASPIIFGVGALFGTAAAAIYAAWDTVGPFFGGVWEGIKTDFQVAYDFILVIAEKYGKLVDWLNSKLGSGTRSSQAAIDANLGASVTAKELAGLKERNKLTEEYVAKKKSLVNVLADTLKNNGVIDADDKKAADAAKKAADAYKRLEKQADDTSKRIADEWIQMTGTQMDVLNAWYADEIAELNQSQAANENYQRDMTRLEETYSEKRRKIMHDEAKKKQETFKSISNGYLDIVKNLSQGALKGSALDLFTMNADSADSLKGIFDYFDNITAEYAGATEQQKKNILESLQAMGIQYKLTTSDMLDFGTEKSMAAVETERQLQDKRLLYYKQCKDIQSEIDNAYNETSFAGLQAALTAENALRLNNFEAQKSLMETWQEAYLASMATMTQLTADMYSQAFGGISTAISDIITGASSAEEAIMSLGKSILKVIADWIAKKIAGTLLAATVGEAALAAETAASIAAADATAAAWAPAAAAVSLASFGANSGPAMAGISATHALSAALSIPKLAEGGITTGPAVAMIGEGRNREVVLPLSDKVFKGIAEGINGAGEKSGATINVYGDINSSSDEDRIFSQFFNDTRFALMGV
jgi:tape measure domain-containing protein